MSKRAELSDRLLEEALRVDHQQVPPDLDRLVRDALAVADRRHGSGLRVPRAWVGWRTTPGLPARWVLLASLVALLLAAMVGALIGSRPPLPTPLGGVENGLVAYAAYVDAAGKPTMWDGQRPEGGAVREIFVGRPDGRETRRITSSRGFKNLPRWSPDGTKIAFLVEEEDWGWEDVRAGELHVLDVVSGRERMIARGDFGLARRLDLPVISWSPDGSRLAYHDIDGLHVVGADGSGHVLVANDGCCGSWSSDSQRLVYGGGPSGLWLYDLRTEVRAPLVRDPAFVAGDARHWSPDGEWVIFMSDAGIETMHAEGGDRRVLVPGSGMWPPFVSPSSGAIAFVMRPGGGATSIWTVRPDGTQSNVVDRAGGAAISRWSPDGMWIAYAQGTETWIVRPDGSGRQRIRTGPGDSLPAAWDWQPVPYPRARAIESEAVPEGHVVLSAGGNVVVLDPESGDEDPIATGNLVALSPDRTRIVRTTNTATFVSRVDGRDEIRLVGPTWDAAWASHSQQVLLYSPGPESFRVVDLASGETTGLPLSEGGKDVGAGSWAPDGRSMAIVGPCWGCLVIADPSGQELRRLTEGCDPWCLAPSWSPDGQSIAYGDGDGWRIVDLDGETLWTMRGRVPAWSPDGTRLAYLVGTEIHVVDRDGSHDRIVAPEAPSLERLRWSPDGSRIAYLAGGPGMASYDLIIVDVDGQAPGVTVRRGIEVATTGYFPFDW